MSKKFVIEDGIMKSEQCKFEDKILGEWFLETLRSKPDFVGQVDAITGEETTYKEMLDKSVRCALWLRKQGLNSKDIVLTCCSNQISSYIPVLSTFYNAAIHFFAFKGINIENIKYFFSLQVPKFIFTEEKEAKLFEEVAKKRNLKVKIITFTKIAGFYYLNDIFNSQIELIEVKKFCCLQPLNPDDPCILTLTSGTTSDCKLISHSYKSIFEALLVFGKNGEENEVSLNFLPFYWIISLRIMLVNISNFTKSIVVKETCHELHEAFNLIEKYKVTKVQFSLGMLYRVSKWKNIKKYNTSSIKIITYGGVKLAPELLKCFIKVAKNGVLKQIYGCSETSIPMCGGIMNEINLNSCGYLFPNMSIKIIDRKTGKTLDPKEPGEICFKSPHFMKGYFNNEEATNWVFSTDARIILRFTTGLLQWCSF